MEVIGALLGLITVNSMCYGLLVTTYLNGPHTNPRTSDRSNAKLGECYKLCAH